jgi:hypothetical protein
MAASMHMDNANNQSTNQTVSSAPIIYFLSKQNFESERERVRAPLDLFVGYPESKRVDS